MELILVGFVAAAGAAAVVLALVRGRDGTAPPSSDLLQEQIVVLRDELQRMAQAVRADTDSLSQRIETRLEGIDTRVHKTLTDTQTQSQALVKDIFERLAEVSSATKNVAEQASQFTLLQDLLRPPKARGGIGEAMLEQLLAQVLPPHTYETQYRFSSGLIVDAVVPLSDRLVCIDSKFPLSNYERMCNAVSDVERVDAERAFAADVAKHIKDIATRYIVPDETFDFAFMYVPAEGVYGEVLRLAHRGQPLFEIAMDARVIPASPLTTYVYLQTIAYGLRCLSIEKNAEKILDFCGQLNEDIRRFSDEYEVLGKHLGNARNKYEDGARKLNRVFDDLARTAELADEDEEELRPPALEMIVGE